MRIRQLLRWQLSFSAAMLRSAPATGFQLRLVGLKSGRTLLALVPPRRYVTTSGYDSYDVPSGQPDRLNACTTHAEWLSALSSLTGDPLERAGGRIVPFRGSPEARIMVIGEAPGATEDAKGIPFCGRAGQLLDNILRAVDLDLERDVYITK